MNKTLKKAVLAMLMASFLILPFASAGFFSGIWDSITGLATTGAFNVSVTLGNNEPNISRVFNASAISLDDDTYTDEDFWFVANDSDGHGNLNDSSAELNFTYGSTIRKNSSCTEVVAVGSYAMNYSCTVRLWYFDEDTYWTISATIRDNSGAQALNNTVTRYINSLQAMEISPLDLSFPSVTILSTDVVASNTIRINNTGNFNYTTGKVEINSSDLHGEDTGKEDYFIPAANFSIDIDAAPCSGGTDTINVTWTSVSGSVLPPGNYSDDVEGQGVETTYYCLRDVPDSLVSQTYSTTSSGGDGPWSLRVVP